MNNNQIEWNISFPLSKHPQLDKDIKLFFKLLFDVEDSSSGAGFGQRDIQFHINEGRFLSRLRQMADQKYIKTGGIFCPFCGSDQIEGGNIDIEGMIAYQPIKCNDCGEYWQDYYSLKGLEYDGQK